MSCREFHESLYEYAQDELDVTIRVTCEQHLVVCRHCVAVVEGYRATITFAKALKPAKSLSAAFEAKLRAMLE
jgi:anti-sigma factor RsiW